MEMAMDRRNSSPWADMQPALLGLVFSHLDDAERCRVVSAVSRHWRSAHQDYPPRRSRFTVKHLPVRVSQYHWFLKVARTITMVEVQGADNSQPGFLSQLLSAAATHSPQLEHLVVPLRQVASLYSVALLTNLRVLEIPEWREISIHSLQCARDQPADLALQVMWDTLAFLASKCSLSLVAVEEQLRQDRLLDHISSLTSIRELWISLAPGHHNTAGLSALSQLTCVRLITKCQEWSFDCIRHMRALKDVSLQVSNEVLQMPTGPLFQQQRPTSLLLCWDHEVSATEAPPTFLPMLLPPATPALGSLQQLGFIGLGLSDFPGEIMQCLTELTHLDISCNLFRRLPPALPSLTALKTLNVAGNPKLEFQAGDARLLGALPDLSLVRLEVAGENPVAASKWSGPSAAMFISIDKQLPHLHLQLVRDAHELDVAWSMWLTK